MRIRNSTHYSAWRLLLAIVVVAGFSAILHLAPNHTSNSALALATFKHAGFNPAPQPESMDFAWGQLTSFILRQLPNNTSIPPDKIDPDWNGDWQDKASLQLGAQGEQACPQSQAKFANKANAFSTIASEHLNVPVQLQKAVPDQPGMGQPNCNGIVVAAMYNPTASNCILGQAKDCTTQLSPQSNLEKLLSSAAKNPIDFPNGTVVVKALWQPIESATISVWDTSNLYFTQQATIKNGFSKPSSWNSNIVLDRTPGTQCSPSDYPIHGSGKAPAIATSKPQVPIACFVTSTDNNYVLMGFNVAHKTEDGWHWITFAWTNSPSVAINGFSSTARPSYLALWSHYLVNFTDTPVDPQGKKICFNPYLEGVPAGGPQSNCTRCHQFATYFPKAYIEGATNGFAPVTRGTAPKLGNNPIPPSESDLENFRKGGLPTDMLWSIVTHWEQ